MASQTEVAAPGEFIYSEAPGTFSRENIVIVSGAGVIPAGRMIAKIDASGKYDNYDNASGTASLATAAGILYAEVDATSADQKAVMICRDAEVVSARVTCETPGAADVNLIAGRTDLAALGIIFR